MGKRCIAEKKSVYLYMVIVVADFIIDNEDD